MAVDTSGMERALGAIGSTFRLVRLYPPTHPAVMEAVRQVTAALPALAAQGTVEWKVGATGLAWHGQHILPRNAQLAELAGLLYSHGVRAIQAHPGLKAEHLLALFGVATGNVPPDDAMLGRLTLMLSRRSGQRRSVPRRTAPSAAVPEQPAQASAPLIEGGTGMRGGGGAGGAGPPPAAMAASPSEAVAPRRASGVFRPDELPPDLEARRALAALQEATTPDAQRGAVERLQSLTAALLGLRDIAAVAEVIAGLDGALRTAQDPGVQELIGSVASALCEAPIVERMVARLGEARMPPTERQVLVEAVGALASLTTHRIVDAFLATPADLREPYRAAIRVAADRAIEALEARLNERRSDVVATATQMLGLTGSPAAVPLLLPLLRHRVEAVREAALLGLAEIGGREISRPAIPALKDESVLVRAAAARAIGVGGDQSATTVLIRRLDQEEDEGVLAELLRAIGRLGAREALAVLARFAEPGSRLNRRTAFVRAAAIEGLAHMAGGEARGLLELYRQDKDPAVKRAAEAALK
ncbi:MAG: HEAT repeat domain-containing protein [Gemmatimonadales bacterium]